MRMSEGTGQQKLVQPEVIVVVLMLVVVGVVGDGNQLFPVLAKLEFEASQTTWTPVRDMKALREVARNTPPRKYLTGENVGGGRGLVVDGGSSGGSAAGNKFWEIQNNRPVCHWKGGSNDH
ncbi:hypothetical protein V1477_002824 [Vespula maculifrons]|uniref:Uncharacterized protein n=1 Tax=Vespula maculifrons TaxID=7453 RepID=A0ABD2CUS5_VESMC